MPARHRAPKSPRQVPRRSLAPWPAARRAIAPPGPSRARREGKRPALAAKVSLIGVSLGERRPALLATFTSRGAFAGITALDAFQATITHPSIRSCATAITAEARAAGTTDAKRSLTSAPGPKGPSSIGPAPGSHGPSGAAMGSATAWSGATVGSAFG